MTTRRDTLRRGSIRRWSPLAAVAIACLSPAAQAATFEESSYGGDYSNDAALPTKLAFAPGGNIVDGTTGNFDNDYFSFSIPTGYVLNTITVLNGSPPPDRIFIGIAGGPSVPAITTFLGPTGEFATSTGLLGWSLFNAGQDGQDILPALGTSSPPDFPPFPGATGFTAPLVAGTYSMWVLDGDGPAGTPYSLDFHVAAVPEPATWAMMIVGFGFVGRALRRRPRTARRTPQVSVLAM